MTINPTSHTPYRKTTLIRSSIPVQKAAGKNLEFTVSFQEKATAESGQMGLSTKESVNPILSGMQGDRMIRSIKDSIASADEVHSFSVDDTSINTQPSVPHEKVESIYDIPDSELDTRLHDAVSACCALDTDGMSRSEIFKRMEAVFTGYLGQDFLEPSIIYRGGMGTLAAAEHDFPINRYQSISMGYHSMLLSLGVTQGDDGRYDPSAIIEAKGFGGMSESEMRKAVRSQYSENMTLKDSILMSNELGDLGLETTDYGVAAVDNIFTTLSANSKEDPNTPDFAKKAKQIFDTMLDMPASFEGIKNTIESDRSPRGNLVFEIQIESSKDDVLKDLLNWIGGSKLYGMDMADKLLEML